MMKRKCIICEKEYSVPNGKRVYHKGKAIRSRLSLTCGKLCSRVYTRIYRQLSSNQKRKVEEITIPIFYSVNDNKKIAIDIESMREEFDDKLGRVYANPKKWVELK